MATAFLVIIYITFISLGLPDSLLGAAWPVMWPSLGVSIGSAGVASTVVACGTIVSSLLSERVIRRFGTGKVTAVSVVATAAALLGISLSPSFWMLVLLAVPLGLGAGAVDAALNNYVALHYAARHMSWLHCFWGVGAFTGPVIMAGFIQRGANWRGGYFTISIVQFAVSLLLFVSLPLWNRQKARAQGEEEKESFPDPVPPGTPPLKIPGVVMALLTFFCYCAIEGATGLWSSSFLVETRGMSEAAGAIGSALYFGSITLGRFVSGFLTSRFSGVQLIRVGVSLCAAGALLLALPLPVPFALFAILLLGLGCAPVYPSMIHETPRRFGAGSSQKIIGFQMASAYTGTTLFPPLVGLVAGKFGVWVFPVMLVPMTLIMLLCSERINVLTKRT